jgi:hypothetical protein
LIVKLSGREFRGWSLVDDRLWNDLAIPVEVICERIDFRLQHVANHREPAVRVAVERAVAEREFRLVAGREQQTALRRSRSSSECFRAGATADSPPVERFAAAREGAAFSVSFVSTLRSVRIGAR